MLSKLMLFMIYLLEEENTSRSLHLDGVVSAHQRFLQFPAQTSGSCLLIVFTLFCITVLALEHSRWDLWGHCYVPVRSWVRSSTFRDWGQNRPIKLLHAKSLLFISTLQYVSYGSLTKGKKTKKASRSYATIYFYMQNNSFSSPRSSTWAMGL